MKRLLVVDSDISSREAIRATFWGLYKIHCTETATEALTFLSSNHCDLLILEGSSPECSDSAFLHNLRKISPEIPLIIVSASYHDSLLKDAQKLPSTGFICKPFDVYEFRNLVAQTLEASNSERHRITYKSELYKKFPVNIIGESPSVQKAIEIARVASQTIKPVIILGETGTGRELLARQIHSWSHRSNEPFAKIECNQPDTKALNSEIFGELHTLGGLEIKSGALDLVGSGSLMLNNAQHLPEDTLFRLVEMLKSNSFHRVGGPGTRVPCVSRLFVSCNVSPENEIRTVFVVSKLTELFDLHILRLPPLRERIQDIPLLTVHYLTRISQATQSKMTGIEPAALQRLQSYNWPGNITELRNILERIMVLHSEEKLLRVEFLPPEIGGSPLPHIDPINISFDEATECLHRQMISTALRISNGKIKMAADLLDLTPRILQHRMEKLGITAADFLINR